MVKSYKEYLAQINTFIFDVDGVLTNGIVTVFPNGELVRHMNIKDGYALKAAVVAGLRVCIISGGTNEGVKIRLKNLGISDIYLGAHNKIKQYEELLSKYQLDPANIIYMGDDIPDIPVMKKVGISCCPADAVSDVKKVANIVSNKTGGEGCVRKIIEEILRLQGNWTVDVN